MGQELYRLSPDGEIELVVDLAEGASGSSPSSLFAHGDKLYFSADDGKVGAELWISDAAGVRMVKDIDPGSGASAPIHIAAFDEEWIWFTARTAAHGAEVWRSNGATAELVRDVRPGPDSSAPTDYSAIGNQMCFAANDGITGHELWCLEATN